MAEHDEGLPSSAEMIRAAREDLAGRDSSAAVPAPVADTRSERQSRSETVAVELHGSTRVPEAAFDPAFRRMARPRGPLRRRGSADGPLVEPQVAEPPRKRSWWSLGWLATDATVDETGGLFERIGERISDLIDGVDDIFD